MQSRDNQGEVVGEINNSFTDNGDRVVTNTMYYRGNPVFQHIAIRDNEGKVRTTNVIGGKILPDARCPHLKNQFAVATLIVQSDTKISVHSVPRTHKIQR
jgi:hypothetical protein